MRRRSATRWRSPRHSRCSSTDTSTPCTATRSDASGWTDEIAAETFTRAFDRRRRYDASRADARPWLLGIAANLLRRHWRTERRRLDSPRPWRPNSPQRCWASLGASGSPCCCSPGPTFPTKRSALPSASRLEPCARASRVAALACADRTATPTDLRRLPTMAELDLLRTLPFEIAEPSGCRSRRQRVRLPGGDGHRVRDVRVERRRRPLGNSTGAALDWTAAPT